MSSGPTAAPWPSPICRHPARGAGSFAARRRWWPRFVAGFCRSRKRARVIRSPSRNSSPGSIPSIPTASRACVPRASSSTGSKRPVGELPDAVDAKITEQVKAGVFPVRLASEDWASGETVWLLDVIAGDRKAATAVLANFRQLSGERAVKIHPLVARMIDQDVLEKLKARPAGAAAETGQETL